MITVIGCRMASTGSVWRRMGTAGIAWADSITCLNAESLDKQLSRHNRISGEFDDRYLVWRQIHIASNQFGIALTKDRQQDLALQQAVGKAHRHRFLTHIERDEKFFIIMLANEEQKLIRRLD